METLTSKDPVKFKTINTDFTVDSDNKVTRPISYEVIDTGTKGAYLFPEAEALIEALVKKGYTLDAQYTVGKNTKDEPTRELVGKSIAQCLVLGIRALNSMTQGQSAKVAFNNSPEKTDSKFADFARWVLANPSSTDEQKNLARQNLSALGLGE